MNERGPASFEPMLLFLYWNIEVERKREREDQTGGVERAAMIDYYE